MKTENAKARERARERERARQRQQNGAAKSAATTASWKITLMGERERQNLSYIESQGEVPSVFKAIRRRAATTATDDDDVRLEDKRRFCNAFVLFRARAFFLFSHSRYLVRCYRSWVKRSLWLSSFLSLSLALPHVVYLCFILFFSLKSERKALATSLLK